MGCLGNGTGNPGVFQANPYPYPSKPVPAYAGTGYLPAGVRVPQGSRVFYPLTGFLPAHGFSLQKLNI